MRIAKPILEFLELVVGSILAGFLIARTVHYVSFDVHGDGFGRDAVDFAFIEGGIVGVVASIPTGIVIYYGILKRIVSVKEVTVILLSSLAGGLVIATIDAVGSIILIPLWAVAIALWIKRRRISSLTSYPDP